MTSIPHTHQLITSNGTYLVKLFDRDVEEVGSLSEVKEILSEAPINANSVEYVIERRMENYRNIPRDATVEVLDAMEKLELERETEKFNIGDTMESNLQAHLEIADSGFLDWRVWSWHGRAAMAMAAE